MRYCCMFEIMTIHMHKLVKISGIVNRQPWNRLNSYAAHSVVWARRKQNGVQIMSWHYSVYPGTLLLPSLPLPLIYNADLALDTLIGGSDSINDVGDEAFATLRRKAHLPGKAHGCTILLWDTGAGKQCSKRCTRRMVMHSQHHNRRVCSAILIITINPLI